jgi:uncharacterized membrane protein YgcG
MIVLGAVLVARFAVMSMAAVLVVVLLARLVLVLAFFVLLGRLALRFLWHAVHCSSLIFSCLHQKRRRQIAISWRQETGGRKQESGGRKRSQESDLLFVLQFP